MIPIVMAQDDDPVASGFVASLARPGGNITGLSVLSPELSGKQLELLKEIVPKLFRVAVPNSNEPADRKTLNEVELAAGTFGVQLQPFDVLSPKDIETAFRVASKAHADAVLVLASALLADTVPRLQICVEEAGSSDVLQWNKCGSRGSDELWAEPYRFIAPRRHLRR